MALVKVGRLNYDNDFLDFELSEITHYKEIEDTPKPPEEELCLEK